MSDAISDSKHSNTDIEGQSNGGSEPIETGEKDRASAQQTINESLSTSARNDVERGASCRETWYEGAFERNDRFVVYDVVVQAVRGGDGEIGSYAKSGIRVETCGARKQIVRKE